MIESMQTCKAADTCNAFRESLARVTASCNLAGGATRVLSSGSTYRKWRLECGEKILPKRIKGTKGSDMAVTIKFAKVKLKNVNEGIGNVRFSRRSVGLE